MVRGALSSNTAIGDAIASKKNQMPIFCGRIFEKENMASSGSEIFEKFAHVQSLSSIYD